MRRPSSSSESPLQRETKTFAAPVAMPSIAIETAMNA